MTCIFLKFQCHNVLGNVVLQAIGYASSQSCMVRMTRGSPTLGIERNIKAEVDI